MNYLYFAPNTQHSAFKIGFSNSPDIRLNNVVGSINYHKTYIFQCKDMQALEDFCHRYFKDFNVKIYEGDGDTEWYDISVMKVAKNFLIENQKMLGIISHYKFNEQFTERPSSVRKVTDGTMTEEELDTFLQQVAQGNNSIRNVAIVAVSHYMGLKVSEITPFNIGDVVKNIDSIKNEPLKNALTDYLEFRMKKDGLVFNHNAPLFVSQQGNRFLANSLARMLLNLYREHGYPDCSSETGRKSAKLRANKRYEEAIDKFSSF